MASYEDSVFINCPFDSEYRAIFYALVFAVYDCGYVARCALEVDDSGLGVCRRKFYVARHKKIGAQELSLDYIGRHEDIQALQSGSTLSVASRASRLAP